MAQKVAVWRCRWRNLQACAAVRCRVLKRRKIMRSPQDRRYFYVGAAVLALVLALAVGQTVLQGRVDAQGRTVQAPTFEVDPLWPKPLPNHWLLGATIGVWVDDQDHVWIIYRSSATLNNNEKGLEL